MLTHEVPFHDVPLGHLQAPSLESHTLPPGHAYGVGVGVVCANATGPSPPINNANKKAKSPHSRKFLNLPWERTLPITETLCENRAKRFDVDQASAYRTWEAAKFYSLSVFIFPFPPTQFTIYHRLRDLTGCLERVLPQLCLNAQGSWAATAAS